MSGGHVQTVCLTSVMLLYGIDKTPQSVQATAGLPVQTTDCGKTVIRNPSLRCITVIMACLCRERGRSGSSSGGLGGAGGGGQSELQLQRQRLIARRKALQKKLSEVNNNNVQPSNKCICIAPWSLLEGPSWEASTSMQLPSTPRQLPPS